MKRILSFSLMCALLILVSGCAHHYQPTKYPNANLVQENWSRQVETSAEHWKQGASQWFLTGETSLPKSHYKDIVYKDAPPRGLAMSTMMVDVPQFSKISIDGPFQVQIFSSDQKNSVYMFGPNAGLRSAVIETKGDLLCISVAKGANNIQDMQNVVIRIGVADLKHLMNAGQGRIEARQLRSSGMTLVNKGSGNLYLEGYFTLNRIEHTGSGCVNIFGAKASALDLCTNGTGRVNVAGQVGLRSIKHEGKSDINLIGVNGRNTKIDAQGEGKIGLNGNLDLRELKAGSGVCVYGYRVHSPGLYVYASGQTCVGLAGYANNLYLNASDNAFIEARYLESMDANVRATQTGHINVMASHRLFASSVDNSSIYYFGVPESFSEFVSGNGVILPIWDGSKPHTGQTIWKDQPVKKKVHKKVSTHKRTRQYKKS